MRFAAVLLFLALAGCTDMPRFVYGTASSSDIVRGYLQGAGAAGPVLIEVRGRDAAFAPAIAAAASGEVMGANVRFTADRARAPQPDYRVAFQFDPAPTATDAAVCAGTAASAPPAAGQTRYKAVFCHKDRQFAAVEVWGPGLTGAADPGLAPLVRQTMLELFPLRDPNSPDGEILLVD